METSLHYFLFTVFSILMYYRSCLGESREIHAMFSEGINHREIKRNSETLENGRYKNVDEFDKFARCSKSTSRTQRYVVNVDKFGAKSYKKDNSQAFLKAWKKACSTNGSIFLVPAHKVYHLKPINFEGPCKSGVTARIQGNVVASKNPLDYEKDRRVWIKFRDLTDFSVDGGGVLYGNGHIWWIKNCHIDKKQPCIDAPTALTFEKCKNLKVKHLQIKDAQQQHLSFSRCVNVKASNITVNSSATSPNTDGIHVTKSRNIQLNNCEIKTGDDCISIVGGSHNIRVVDIKCGPGHGISIGSLGKNGAIDHVSNILVTRAIFNGSTNGVRIKSWQGGRGYAKNIIYENITMHNVTNPIVIDQFYCDKKGHNCATQEDAVQVENVLYKNIKGSSDKEDGIIFNCSATVPCKGIKLQNVQLMHKGNGNRIQASCTHVNVQEVGRIIPRCPTS